MKYFLVAFILFSNVLLCVQDVMLEGVDLLESEEDGTDADESGSRRGSYMRSHVNRIVKMYLCDYPEIVNDGFGKKTLVYGEKSWIFPYQNVNLTLAYPTHEVSKDIKIREHWITGFKVILHLDNEHSQGKVLAGGILEDEITLSFVMENISTLSYQFWVYGIEKSQFTHNRETIDKNCS